MRALVIGLALAVAACRDKPAESTVAGGGEVLPGSVSDAMIDYGALRSRPPLAQASGAGSERAATTPDDAAAPAAQEAASGEPSEAAPAPATDPATLP